VLGESALSLAALRVVVAGLLVVGPSFHEAANLAAWDRARWVIPEGLHWFVALVPISPRIVTVVQVGAVFFALLAVVGVRARLALALLGVCAFYLGAISQLGGNVWHDMHLLWFSALLAASPCDDVLALDARKPISAEGPEYGLPLLFVRLMFGAIYFFPGLHKLLTSGLDWALSDNLRYQLYAKWLEHGNVPAFRVDQVPGLLETAGLCVLLFELSFGFLIQVRRLRPWLCALGLGFHLSTQLVFSIPFASIWLCYVALLDLRPAFARAERWASSAALLKRGLTLVRTLGRARDPAERVSPPALVLAVGSVLLAGALIQGARGQMQSYPFACYPTFEYVAGRTLPDLSIEFVAADGSSRELAHARNVHGYRTQRQWAEVWNLAGAYGRVEPARLRAYYASLPNRAESPHVRFFRVERSVIPEDHGRGVRRTLIYESRGMALSGAPP
jgi:hypothetical protein